MEFDTSSGPYQSYGTICYYRNKKIRHVCGQVFGEECILNWALTSIASNKVGGQGSIHCLFNSGETRLTYEDLSKHLSKASMEQVNEAYNQNYFHTTEDIAKCPRPAGDYAGFFQRRACRSNMVGEKGKFEWKDFSQLTIGEKVSKSVKESLKFNPETFSYFNEIMLSNPCPGGGMAIYKIDGCPHMVCQRCKYEFCWIGLGNYPGYTHKGDTIGGIRKTVTTVMVMMAIIIALMYFFYADFWISRVVKFLGKFGMKFVISNIIGLAILLIFPIALGFAAMFNTYHSDLCTIFMRLSLGLLLIVYPIGWAFLLYFSYFSSYLSFIPMYIIYEIIGAVVLIIAGIILFLAGLFCVYVLPHIVVFLAKLSLQIGGKVYRLILRK